MSPVDFGGDRVIRPRRFSGSASLKKRLGILIGTVALAVAGTWMFYAWDYKSSTLDGLRDKARTENLGAACIDACDMRNMKLSFWDYVKAERFMKRNAGSHYVVNYCPEGYCQNND